MKEIGAKFKQKRKELDISLDQARNETKIKISYLKAIERGAFGEVDQEVYLKGFLKIYADYLGLDKRKIMQEYREYKKNQEQENQDPEEQEIEEKQTIGDRIKEFIDHHQNKVLYVFMSLLLLLIMLAVLFLGTVIYKSFNAEGNNLLSNVETYVEKNLIEEEKDQKDADYANKKTDASLDQTEERQEETKGETKGENKEENNVTSDEQNSNNKQDLSQEKVEPEAEIQNPNQVNLIIKAIASSWCVVDINGKTAFKGTMKAGTSKKFNGENIKLKISNGAGIKVIKNGQELGPFGKAGEVIVKEFSLESE